MCTGIWEIAPHTVTG
ncbi:hypothetical protein CEXT_327701, partial [Caerostris extrusa]